MRQLLKGLYKRETEDKGGQQPYDSVVIFKAVLLAQWYSLSDPELEQALRVRLDFIAFTHIPLDQLLDEINSQLQAQQLMVQKASGALLDATLVASSQPANHSGGRCGTTAGLP